MSDQGVAVKLKSLKELQKTLADYFRVASDVMVRVDPTTHASFERRISELPAELDRTEQLFASATGLADYLAAYSSLESVYSTLTGLAGILNTPYYEERLTTSKSVGFQTQIREYVSRIRGIIDTYRTRSAKDDERDIAKVVSKLNLTDATAREAVIRDIIASTVPSRLLVEVARALIRIDPGVSNRLEPTIARLKSHVLGDSTISGTATTDNIESWLTYQCDLTPGSVWMTHEELVTELGGKYDKSLSFEENLLANTKENLLLVDRSGEREVDYCILPLTDSKYIAEHQLHTSPTSGLNKRVLKRFGTLRDILTEPAAAKMPPKFVLRDISHNTLAVVTMGIYARLLMEPGMASPLVSTNVAQSLLAPLSSRPTKYSEIESDYILSVGEALEYRLIIKWYEELMAKPPYQTADLKADVVHKLVDSVKIDPTVHNTAAGFSELCRGSYTPVLVAETARFLGERALSGREKRSTFTVRMAGLVSAFASALELVLTSKVATHHFTERGDISRHLKGLYGDCMRATVEILDTPPSKFQQLGITLKEHFLKSRGGVAT